MCASLCRATCVGTHEVFVSRNSKCEFRVVSLLFESCAAGAMLRRGQVTGGDKSWPRTLCVDLLLRPALINLNNGRHDPRFRRRSNTRVGKYCCTGTDWYTCETCSSSLVSYVPAGTCIRCRIEMATLKNGCHEVTQKISVLLHLPRPIVIRQGMNRENAPLVSSGPIPASSTKP